MADQLLTVQQACDRLSVCRSTLYELFDSGQLASIKIGKARRIPESSLDAFIRGRIGESAA